MAVGAGLGLASKDSLPRGSVVYGASYVSLSPPPNPGALYPAVSVPPETSFDPQTYSLPFGWKVRRPPADTRTTVTRDAMLRLIDHKRIDRHWRILACDLALLTEGPGPERLVYLVVSRGFALTDGVGGAFLPGPRPVVTPRYYDSIGFGLFDPNTAGGFEFQSGDPNYFAPKPSATPPSGTPTPSATP